MEIIVDSAGYPTEMIAKNSHDYPHRSASATPTSARSSCPSACPTTPTPAATSPEPSPPSSAATPTTSPPSSRKPARRSPPPPLGICQQAGSQKGGSLPRLLRQPRALPRRHPHAPRRSQQDRPNPANTLPNPSSVPQLDSLIQASGRRLGRRPHPGRTATAIATPRSPSSPPPAPSAS